MSGIKYLLDTNFILGILKSNSVVIADEDVVIDLRQTRRIKLPDAIIVATALCTGVELLTLDKRLQSIVNSGLK